MASGSQAAAVQLKAQLDERDRALAACKEALMATTLELDGCPGLG